MNLILIFLSLAGGLTVGLIAALFALRYVTERQQQAQQASVAAAVSAAMVERRATAETLKDDREATVHAAVARAAELAEVRLDARLRQGNERLEAGSAAFEKETSNINTELRRMQKMVTDLQERASGQHGQVLEGLQQATRATTQLREVTGGLRDALANPKARGQWGERMAEDVLRAAGFKRGVNYDSQKAIPSGGIPDITFFLPGDMSLHMDVKFPLDNYVRYLEALEADDGRADDFRSQFRKDAKTTVTDLASRGYSDGASTVDYVLLFMPNESVYSFVHDNDPSLVEYALSKKVVLCGPSTLFAVLSVIRQAMDNFTLEQRSEEIMACLSGFSAEWNKFSAHVKKLGKNLNTVQNTFDELDGARSNQMQRKLRAIDELHEQRGELRSGDPVDYSLHPAPDSDEARELRESTAAAELDLGIDTDIDADIEAPKLRPVAAG